MACSRGWCCTAAGEPGCGSAEVAAFALGCRGGLSTRGHGSPDGRNDRQCESSADEVLLGLPHAPRHRDEQDVPHDGGGAGPSRPAEPELGQQGSACREEQDEPALGEDANRVVPNASAQSTDTKTTSRTT